MYWQDKQHAMGFAQIAKPDRLYAFPIAAVLPAAITAVGGLIGQLFQNRSARKEYRQQQQYNTPKAQMQRLQQAGLSPYLAYGQANTGNMTTPQPAKESGIEHVGRGAQQGIENYMSMGNFDVAQKNQWMDYWMKNQQNQNLFADGQLKEVELRKKLGEFYSDYPTYIEGMSHDVANEGYRTKLNELKRQASKANVDRITQTVENMKYKNVVDSVRAGYAKDYGMVGGDWTQGMGLLKSLPSFFKRGKTTLPKTKLETPPWRGSLKVNPRRRIPSKGVINP